MKSAALIERFAVRSQCFRSERREFVTVAAHHGSDDVEIHVRREVRRCHRWPPDPIPACTLSYVLIVLVPVLPPHGHQELWAWCVKDSTEWTKDIWQVHAVFGEEEEKVVS